MTCIEAGEIFEKVSYLPKGYAQIRVGPSGQKSNTYVHRLVWEECFGPIPEGMFVCHKCDNPPCVNPEHLFLGTAKDNVVDMDKKGRRANRKGELHPLAKLTEDQVKEIRDSTESGAALARRFGVHKATIYDIRHKRKWRHL